MLNQAVRAVLVIFSRLDSKCVDWSLGNSQPITAGAGILTNSGVVLFARVEHEVGDLSEPHIAAKFSDSWLRCAILHDAVNARRSILKVRFLAGVRLAPRFRHNLLDRHRTDQVLRAAVPVQINVGMGRQRDRLVVVHRGFGCADRRQAHFRF